MNELYFRVNIIADADDLEELGPEANGVEKLVEDLALNKPEMYFEELLRSNLKRFAVIGGRGFDLKINKDEPEVVAITITLDPKRCFRISTSLMARP